MAQRYKLSMPDGSEFVVNDIAALQRLYHQGSITGEVLIAPLNSANWQSLKDLFDLSQWNTPPPDGNAVPGYAVSEGVNKASVYAFKPSTDLEKPSNRGLYTAGVLFLVNAGFSFVSLIAIVALGLQPEQAVLPVAILTLDILIGINLCRGEWGRFAMYRLAIGLVLIAILYPMFFPGPMAYFVIGSQFFFLTGFVILLFGEYITIVRAVTGAGIVALSWLTIFGGSFMVTKVPVLRQAAEASQFKTRVKHYAMTDRRFDDPYIRNIRVDLPDGWLQLKPNNPVVPIPAARMVAVHLDSGCQASLAIEYYSAVTHINSPDDFLDLQKRALDSGPKSSFKEIKREPTHFGDDTAQRMEAVWVRNGQRQHYWYSVCKIEDYFFILSGWCTEGDVAKAFQQYQELEKRFKLPSSSYWGEN